MATLTLDQTPPTLTVEGTVAFKGLLDGQLVSCRISEEALMDHFGATGVDATALLGTFLANRAAIETVAAAKLPARIANGQTPLLKTADF